MVRRNGRGPALTTKQHDDTGEYQTCQHTGQLSAIALNLLGSTPTCCNPSDVSSFTGPLAYRLPLEDGWVVHIIASVVASHSRCVTSFELGHPFGGTTDPYGAIACSLEPEPT